MADDAGALLVRSGLVSQTALENARLRVIADGGTLGEALVVTGVVTDDALTEFYRQRLLVPQVNPNTLAKLSPKVVTAIPGGMAVELRAVPVSLDSDNNLTVAMSDPSDRHAVDEIASFTGTYVVRAVATQMQIAWCLAHYYGHVTHLGEKLLRGDEAKVAETAAPTRKRGVTEQVKALRTKRLERGAVLANDVMAELAGSTAATEPAEPSEPDATKSAVRDDASTPVDMPVRPRARTPSGELRIRPARAPSVRPALPDDSGPIVIMEAGEPSGPVITIESDSRDSQPVITIERAEEPTERKLAAPRRKRPAVPDPPELAARAGEVQLATGEPVKAIDFDVLPSIMISDELERALRPSIQGELARYDREGGPTPTASVISAEADHDEAAIIRQGVFHEKSEPVLLERRRDSKPPPTAAPEAEIDPDDEVSDVVVLELKKPISKRLDKITQVGIGAITAATSMRMSTGAIVSELEDSPTDAQRLVVDNDPTRIDGLAAPASDDYTSASDEVLAAPPAPPDASRDTYQVLVPPPPAQTSAPGPSGAVSFDKVQRAPHSDDDDDDQDDIKTQPTMVMSAVELDEVIPDRMSDPLLARRAAVSDPVDDGWGPPGTTIPPPLLGAIPGSLEPTSGVIPIPDIDSAPLMMVAPPSPPETTARPRTSSAPGAARVLEESTERVLDLIRTLEHSTERDQVIAVMIAHLAETHGRAGFFAARNGLLSLFAIMPRVPSVPTATLRLDRPSTLQDVVGTRLPYRGPMHDDASRGFVTATLGACPAELLLVPICVRERVVGVLFGDNRVKHTFDDQLALAGRAAGMALERILKARK